MLSIVELGNPVLRQEARALSKEEILSPPILKLIQDMVAFTTGPSGGVGLAAPQVGQSLQIIVIEDREEYQKRFCTPEQLIERERMPVPLHVIINPQITLDQQSGEAEFFEGCLSVPGLRGVVPRALAVTVTCLNEKAEPVTIRARGWYARILQHETDHLKGILFIDRARKETLITV
ncbi:MAG: peptide deformylase [Verrucomicrobia bacterium]|nr:peptide deformylase [Verrucomicrobiota bacterium]